MLAWDISTFASSSGPVGDGIVVQCQLAVIIKKLVTQYLLAGAVADNRIKEHNAIKLSVGA